MSITRLSEVLSRFHRRRYQRSYYRTQRASRAYPTERLPAAMASGRGPRISRERYDALVAWKQSPKSLRPKLWDIADQWGEDVGYLWGLVRRGSKRYDRERYEELLSLVRACVDEARAQP